MRDHRRGSCVSVSLSAFQRNDTSEELHQQLRSPWQSLQQQHKQQQLDLEQQQQHHEQQQHHTVQRQLRHEQQQCTLQQQQHAQGHYKLQQQQHEQQCNLQQQQHHNTSLHLAGHNLGAAADETAADDCCSLTAHAAGSGATAQSAGYFSQHEREAAARALQTTARKSLKAAVLSGAEVIGEEYSETDVLGSNEEKEYYVWDPVSQEYKQTDAVTGEALLHDPQYTQCHFRLVDDVVEELHQPLSQQQHHKTSQEDRQQLHSQRQKLGLEQHQVDHHQQLHYHEQQYTQQQLQQQQYTQLHLQSQQFYPQRHVQQQQCEQQQQPQPESSCPPTIAATAAPEEKAEEEWITHAGAAAAATPLKIYTTAADISTACCEEQQQKTYVYDVQMQDNHGSYTQPQGRYCVDIDQQGQSGQRQRGESVQQLGDAGLPLCRESSWKFPGSAAATAAQATPATSFVPTNTHQLKCPPSAASTLRTVTYPLSSTKFAAAAPVTRVSYSAAASAEWHCCRFIKAATEACRNCSPCCCPSCTPLPSSEKYLSECSALPLSTTVAAAQDIAMHIGGPLSTAATAPGTPSTSATAAAVPLAATAQPSTAALPPTAALTSTAAFPEKTPLPSATTEATPLFSAQGGTPGALLGCKASVSAAATATTSLLAGQTPELRSVLLTGAEKIAARRNAVTVPLSADCACYCADPTEQTTVAGAADLGAKENSLLQALPVSTSAHCCRCSSAVSKTCCCGSYDQKQHNLQQHKQVQQIFPVSQRHRDVRGPRTVGFPAHCESNSTSSLAAAAKAAPATAPGHDTILPTYCAAATCCSCHYGRQKAFPSPDIDTCSLCPAWKSPPITANLHTTSSVIATAPPHLSAQISHYSSAAPAPCMPPHVAAVATESICNCNNTGALIQGDGICGYYVHPHDSGWCCGNKSGYNCRFSSCCCTHGSSYCSSAADCCHKPAYCRSAKCCAAAQVMKKREKEEAIAKQATYASMEQQQQQHWREAQQYGNFSSVKPPCTEQRLQTSADQAAAFESGSVTPTTTVTTAGTLTAESAAAATYEVFGKNQCPFRQRVEKEISSALSCKAPGAAAGWLGMTGDSFAAEQSTGYMGNCESPTIIQPQHQWHTQQHYEQWQRKQQQKVKMQQQNEMVVPQMALLRQPTESLYQQIQVLQHPNELLQQQTDVIQQQQEVFQQQKEESPLQQQQGDMQEAACGACPKVWGEGMEERNTNNTEDRFLQHEALWWDKEAFAGSLDETEVLAPADTTSVTGNEKEEREVLLTPSATLAVQKQQQHIMLKQPSFSTRMSTSRPWGDLKRSKARSASFNIPTVSIPAVLAPDAIRSFGKSDSAFLSSMKTDYVEETHLFTTAAANSAVYSPAVLAHFAHTNTAEKPVSYYRQPPEARPRTAAAAASGRETHSAQAASLDRHAPFRTSVNTAAIPPSDGRHVAGSNDSDAIVGKAAATACPRRGGEPRCEPASRAVTTPQAHVNVLPSSLQQLSLQNQQLFKNGSLVQQEQQSGSALQQNQQARRTTLQQQHQQRILQHQENSFQRSGSSSVQQQRQGAGRRATYHTSNSTDNNAVAAKRNTANNSPAATAGHISGGSAAIAGACNSSSLSSVANTPLKNQTVSMPARAATARKATARTAAVREVAAQQGGRKDATASEASLGEVAAREAKAREAAARTEKTGSGTADGRRCLGPQGHLQNEHLLTFHATARSLQHERSPRLAAAAQTQGRAGGFTRIAVPTVVKEKCVNAAEGQRRRAEASGSLRSFALKRESSCNNKAFLRNGVGAFSSSRAIAALATSPVSACRPGSVALPASATGGVRTGAASSRARLSASTGAAARIGGTRKRLHDPVTRGRQLRAAWQEDPLVNKKNTFDVVAYETWLRNNGHLLRAKALELHQEEQRLLQLLQQQAPYNF